MLIIESSTVTNNVATGRGGGVSAAGSSPLELTIQNSIIAGNMDNGSAPDFSPPRNFGRPATASIFSVKNNLIGDNTGSLIDAAAVGSPDANGNFVGTNAAPIDPQLAPLAFAGGLTKTHALTPDSPAINAGELAFSSTIAVDQRGTPFLRVADGHVDMGAYERQAIVDSFFIVTTATDELDYSNTDVSLREAVSSANGSLGADEITFDPAIFTGGNASLIRLTAGELEIREALTIDGSTASGVTITGDAFGNDITDGANVTNVAASFTTRLADNSRVLNFAVEEGDLVLDDLTITGGRTIENSQDGGGILFSSEGALLLVGGTLSGNSTVGSLSAGGGISTEDGAVILINSEVSGNRTEGVISEGGGINARRNDVTVLNSTISNNSTLGFASEGGGINTFDGAVTLTNSTLSKNTTTGDSSEGGGINTQRSTVVLTMSTLSGNRANGDGGGINNVTGEVTLTSSTVSGNFSSGNGGGIYTREGTLSLINSTLTENSASSGDGIFFPEVVFNNSTGTLTVRNSIIADNGPFTINNGRSPDVQLDPDTTLTVEHSLIGIADGLNIADNVGNLTGTAANPLDPILGELADNGGPTQTHALLPGSPAIDAGNNALAVDQNGWPLVKDQRGFSRLIDGDNDGTATVDMGAYEVGGISPLQFPLVISIVRDEGGVLARPDLLATLAVSFDLDVIVSADDLVIRNDTLGGAVVDSSGLLLNYDATSRTATWDFSSLTLDAAFYSFELSSDIVSVEGWSAPIFCTTGYESTGWLRLTAGRRQFSASGAPAEEAENCRANSAGVR